MCYSVDAFAIKMNAAIKYFAAFIAHETRNAIK